MKQTNTLIVGQGIAGSLAAFMLQNIPFLVMDPGFANSASRVAAGMFTPISGKRKTLNAVMLEQIPFAMEVYRQVEELLDKKILHLQNIYYIPTSNHGQKEFIKKLEDDDFAKYVLTDPRTLPGIQQDFEAFEITNSGWVDCALFTNSFKDWLIQNGLFIEEEFKYEKLLRKQDILRYKQMEFSNIIFCEGYRGFNNPFFSDDDIIPCKGDVLVIEYKGGPENRIVKKNSCYLVPAGENIFKAGSTYKWFNSNENLDEAGKREIEDKLDTILQNKYTVLKHQTAIRPTTQNREVIAKQHHEYPGLFMLNGLGTKGVIQGPAWAKFITDLSHQINCNLIQRKNNSNSL